MIRRPIGPIGEILGQHRLHQRRPVVRSLPRFHSPAAIARRGVVRSFQISAVFAHLSVLENVRVALQRKLHTSFHFWRSERSLDSLNAEAIELLRAVDLDAYAALPAVELSYGRKRALEIATTLAMSPTLMLLDEPTQGMGLEDVDRIRELIKKVAASRTVLMVEHNMSVVAKLAEEREQSK